MFLQVIKEFMGRIEILDTKVLNETNSWVYALR